MGPVMIGPSSSHTAGAVRIGLYARRIYDKEFKNLEIHLYNSFAITGKGHGTDKAIVGGLLGMKMDDDRIVNSFSIAKKAGIKYNFFYHHDPEKHPNLAKIIFCDDEPYSISGISVGGGKISIIEINGKEVDFSGRHEYLILSYKDVPGMVGKIGTLLGDENINIAYLQISRDASEEKTLALFKLDTHCPDNIVAKLKEDKNIFKVTRIEKLSLDIK
jgi:L-serine dehydratase